MVFRRGQAAMEFLMTYGWAILVVLIVIGVLLYSGFANISNLLPEKCTFSISVKCLDHSVKKDSIQLRLENAAGREMVVRSITATSEALAGPSDSAPGTCELSNTNKNSRLKKGAKKVFNLNVRSSTALASGPETNVNNLNLLTDNILLVRAQDACADWEAALTEAETANTAASSNHDAVRYAARAVANAADNAAEPSLYRPTVDSVHQKAKERADDFLSANGNTAAFNEIVGYYAGLVADEATRNNPQNVRAAYQNVYNSRHPLLTDVYNAFSQVRAEANRAANPRGVSLTSIKNAAEPERSEFDAGPAGELSFDYAMKVLDSIYGQHGYEAVEKAPAEASRIINEITNNLPKISEAARREAEREFNADTVKQVIRDKTENLYSGKDSYFAANFVAEAVESSSIFDEIRQNANTALHTHIYRPNRERPSLSGGSLFRYYVSIASSSNINTPPRYSKNLTTGNYYEVSFADYLDYFKRDRDGPVLSHYHNLIRDRVIPAYTNELNNLGSSDFVNGLSGGDRRKIQDAFNDPYYSLPDSSKTICFYPRYGVANSPLDDCDLRKRHPEANELLNEELYRRFKDLTSDMIWGAMNAGEYIHRQTINELGKTPNAGTVKAEAEKAIRRLGIGGVNERAGKFVRERIASSDEQDMQRTVSDVEAAVDEAIQAVTYGANLVVQKVQDAYAARAPSVSSVKTAAQNGAGSSSGSRGHRAAVFVAGIADVDADDPSDVIANIERDIQSVERAVVSATQEVVQAANDETYRSVREIEPDVAYVQEESDRVVERLRQENHPGLAAAELVAGAVSGPGSARDAAIRADDKSDQLIREAFASQRTVQGRFHSLRTCVLQCRSLNVDHEETGDCPVSLLDCSVLGVSCSGNGDCCSGVCEAGSCAEVTVLCGSVGLACCSSGDACVSGLECRSGTCQAVEDCGSEGQVCCGGVTCDEGLMCDGVTCVGAVVECGSGGQVCCDGSTCNGDLVCDGGTCMDATVSVPTDTHSFDDPIDPDSPVGFPIANDDIPFESVNFTVSDTVTGLNLTITSQSDLPSDIPEGPGVVPSSNGYINITSNLDPDYFDNANVSSVNVTFKVERSFVSGNRVLPDDVSLFRYDETAREWVEIDTRRLPHLDDVVYHYYEAIGAGDLLGVFAIALSQYISCAHIETSKGKNRYNIELVYSWQDSQSINHRIKGELLANTPK